MTDTDTDIDTDADTERRIVSIRSRQSMVFRNIPACRVTSRIWLGSRYDAIDDDWLREEGITHVLNCAYEIPGFNPSTVRECMVLNADDHPDYPILERHFEATQYFLDRALMESDSQILVHCMAGINRSATLALAYASYHSDRAIRFYRFADCFERVMEERPFILSNEGFYQQLLEWLREPIGAVKTIKNILPFFFPNLG